MNLIILVAIVAQSYISKTSRMAGAVVGYLITTGILLWGLSLYNAGSGIALFFIPLSKPMFLVACLAWYGFDTRALLRARQFANRNAQLAEKSSGASSTL